MKNKTIPSVTPSARRAISPSLSRYALALMAVCAAPGHAQETLDPIVVTASKGQDTNTVVRAKRIEVEQATSLRDLFQQTPEVGISGGMSAAQKLYVRGLSERMLAVTIDGAAQAESAYHHAGQIMVEPELLKRVEIEAGTGAATAGPGALAGALRLSTKSALDLLKPGEKAGGLIKAGYQSAASATKWTATAFGRAGDTVDLLASASRLDSHAYQDGAGNKVPNSASDAKSVFLKAGWAPVAGQRLELTHEEREEDGLWNQRTNMLPIDINPATRERTRRESTALNYLLTTDNPLLELHAGAYLNDNRFQLGLDSATPEKLGTRSTGLDVSNVSKLGLHRVTVGLNHRQDTGYATVEDGPLKDETAHVDGVYAQDSMALAEQWQLVVGTRYDQYDYTDMANQRFSSSGASPSASLAYEPVDGLTLRASHARALRGVGIIEPYLKQFQENDSHIDPEKARNTELSATWEQGPWQWVGTLFRQRIDHFISYDDVRDNMGTVRSRGFSTSLGYKAPVWSASLGVAQSHPTLEGQPLSQGDSLLLGNSNGRTWVAQVDYKLPAYNLSLGWTSRLVQKLTDVPEGDTPKSGYDVHDAYAQWQPTGKDDLTVTLTIKNLFDKFYYEQTSFGFHPRWGSVAGFPEPGRDVRVSAAWRF